MYEYSNILLSDVFDIFPTLLMFTNIIPEMHPHSMCTYVSKEQPMDKNVKLYTVVLVSGIMILIMLIQIVQLAYSKIYLKIVLIFKRWPIYMIQQHFDALMHQW